MSSTGPEYKVLLVEDSEDDAFFFERIARRAGLNLQLIHANNGQAAVDILQAALATSDHNALPDLVFLDLKMPELNGFEVLAWVQRQTALADLKIILLSGSEDIADIRRATSLGAKACFSKPIQARQLQTVFKAFVSRGPHACSMPLSENLRILSAIE